MSNEHKEHKYKFVEEEIISSSHLTSVRTKRDPTTTILTYHINHYNIYTDLCAYEERPDGEPY